METTTFAPVRERRAFQAVVAQIAEAIRTGELTRGDRLPSERLLAEQMEVSRPTLREAIKLLVESGVVEVRPGAAGGTFVVSDAIPATLVAQTESRVNEVPAVLQARRLFEPEVARLATRLATDADLAALERIVCEQEASLGNWPRITQLDTRFHLELARTHEERARGLLAVSSGNHAQAVAACAAEQGLDCLVVMTKSASDQKAAAAAAYGAKLDRTAETAAEAIALSEELARTTGRVQIPAYDDRDVIAGQGTIGLELVEQSPGLDTVVVPVSGGGLVSGIAVALKALRPRTRVVAVEAELAPTLARALKAGRPVELESRSLADGLNAPSVGQLCLEICRDLVDETVLVSDFEIVAAMRWLYGAAKLACEPAGAAAVAALMTGRVAVSPGERVVAIVSGGNIDPATAARLLLDEPPAPRGA